MFSERIKSNENLKKLILLVAVIILAAFVLPLQAHAASATKTKKVKINKGQKVQLQLAGVDNKDLKFKSSNKKIASVSKSGRVKAKKKGSAVVRVEYDGVTYKFKINVRKKKKNQVKVLKPVTMKLKKTADSAALADETEDDEDETFVTVKYAGLKTTATGSFAEKNLIMVGDSRFVGMKNTVGGSAKWYAKISMGLTWLKDTVNLPKLIKKGKLDVSGKAIVFNLGVNDLGNVSNYITYLNDLGETLRKKGATVYFMTVNPIDDKKAKKWSTVRNKNVITFNKRMAAGLDGFGIIDTYDELVFEKFSTVDGVHYDAATYRKIYNYMKKCICA